MATVTYNSAGSGNWLCPVNVFTVTVACWGGGGGGQAGGGLGGAAGAGGEYASDTVAVTPGTLYPWQVATGGAGGKLGGAGPTVGGRSTFSGGSVNVTAHGGGHAGAGTGGLGGTGSTNATHFSGGNGGIQGGSGNGGGGGSSAGTAANGNNGSNGSAGGGGAGGTAPAGGAAGGTGGTGPGANGAPGSAPGAGGGGSGAQGNGGAGAPGQVQLTYTVATQPLVPFFPAGLPLLPQDFNNLIQAPLSFLTSKVAFRAELTTGQVMSSGGTTVLAFNSILEDPFAGWESGPSQWLAPAGQTATYHVAVTVSCVNNIGALEVQALAGLNSASALYGLAAVSVPTAGGGGNALASGAVPVQLYGGQDTVQGLAIVTGGAGTTVSTAGQRCELTITYQNG